MREIKFRAWDKEKNKMYYSLTLYPSCQIVVDDDSVGILKSTSVKFPLNPGEFELMQYTGLKDKNGREIYEGDIVQWGHLSHGYIKSVIEFVAGIFQQYPQTAGVISSSLNQIVLNCEVVGNIYENPEILKAGATDGGGE